MYFCSSSLPQLCCSQGRGILLAQECSSQKAMRVDSGHSKYLNFLTLTFRSFKLNLVGTGSFSAEGEHILSNGPQGHLTSSSSLLGVLCSASDNSTSVYCKCHSGAVLCIPGVAVAA